MKFNLNLQIITTSGEVVDTGDIDFTAITSLASTIGNQLIQNNVMLADLAAITCFISIAGTDGYATPLLPGMDAPGEYGNHVKRPAPRKSN